MGPCCSAATILLGENERSMNSGENERGNPAPTTALPSTRGDPVASK